MFCTSPFTVYPGAQRAAGRDADAAALRGKPLSFSNTDPVVWADLKKGHRASPRTRGDGAITVDCGMCGPCRLKKTAHNTTRGMAEFRAAGQVGIFLTLTLSDDRIRCDEGLRVRDPQLFKKRLRDRIGPFRSVTIGEYGEKTARPHYHLLIFGHDFAEGRVRQDRTSQGDYLWSHPAIDDAWDNQGIAWFGEITRDRTGGIDYVMRYALKHQVFGDHARKVYGREKLAPGWVVPRDLSKFIAGDQPGEYFSPEDGSLIPGVLFEVPPQFALMPRRPGLGASWFDQFWREVLPRGEVNWYGRKRPVPPYFLHRARELGEEAEGALAEYLARRADKEQRDDDAFWTEEFRRADARGNLLSTTRAEIEAQLRADPYADGGELLRKYDVAKSVLAAAYDQTAHRAFEYRKNAMERQKREL